MNIIQSQGFASNRHCIEMLSQCSSFFIKSVIIFKLAPPGKLSTPGQLSGEVKLSRGSHEVVTPKGSSTIIVMQTSYSTVEARRKNNICFFPRHVLYISIFFPMPWRTFDGFALFLPRFNFFWAHTEILKFVRLEIWNIFPRYSAHSPPVFFYFDWIYFWFIHFARSVFFNLSTVQATP